MLASVGVFAILSGLLWLQADSLDRKETRMVAENMHRYMRHILREARRVSLASEQIVATRCTEPERNRLSDIIAGAPHLHSITRLVDGTPVCSSLTGQVSRQGLSHISLTGQMLSLQSYPAPGAGEHYPLLILAIAHGNHVRTDVAINGVFLQSHLRRTQDRQTGIRVGDRILGAQGTISTAPVPLPARYAALTDDELPFSVIYSTASGLTPGRFIRTWPLPLGGALLLALVTGGLCRRQIFSRATPRKNLLTAIRSGDIRTVYQPIVRSSDGSVVGFEALCRWHHPTEGMISPDVFIPLAEQTGLIVLLTQYQLEQIARDVKDIAPLLAHPFYISVNFSRQHYTSGAFLHDCDHLIKSFRPLKCRLVVEITEREQLVLTPETEKRFTWLRQAGAAIALDDFGTGYSNLAWVSALKPDYLKIDKLFVSHMRPGHTALLDCVTELAGKLGLHTIAEGIETPEQAAYLKEKGVDSQQGFYWYHPMDKPALTTALGRSAHSRN